MITETSGNGYALYNGVKLPNIDSVWTDKESYPYAMVNTTGSFSALYLMANVPSVNADGNYDLSAGGKIYGIVYDQEKADGYGDVLGLTIVPWQWFYLSDIEADTEDILKPFWANFDILNSDNSVSIATSNPIPLDGMTVIEWDGDTTGLTTGGSDAMGLVKLSDKVPDVTKPAAEVVTTSAAGTNYAYTEKATYDDTNSHYYWNATAWHNYTPKATDAVPETGIWVTSSVLDTTTTATLFAFYESEGDTEDVTYEETYSVTSAGLIATADAIRDKLGTSDKITWNANGFADAMSGIAKVIEVASEDELPDASTVPDGTYAVLVG